MNTQRKKNEFFDSARHTMVDCQIRPDGVIDENILAVFSNLPRETFIPESLQGVAYFDNSLVVNKDHFILSPSVHARMVEALEPKDKHIALDISVSNGYSPAVLASLVSTVIAVDPKEDRLEKISKAWADQKIYNAVGIHGPLKEGAAEHAPYDLILLHGSVSAIPTGIAAQLKPNGRMVCIIKEQNQTVGQATLVRKTSQNGYASKILFETTAPYLPGFAPTSESFVF